VFNRHQTHEHGRLCHPKYLLGCCHQRHLDEHKRQELEQNEVGRGQWRDYELRRKLDS
jgi:hypothetical protein